MFLHHANTHPTKTECLSKPKPDVRTRKVPTPSYFLYLMQILTANHMRANEVYSF